MSRFSGKFDLYDWLSDRDLDYIKRSKIYVGCSFDKDTFEMIPDYQVHVETMKDLVPYYPYIVSVAFADHDSCTIYLCEKPYPDMMWEELGKKPLMYDFYKEELEREMNKYLTSEE